MSTQSPSSAEASQALRDEILRLRKEELPLLDGDVTLLPVAPQIQYRYGLALYVDGQKKLAAEHLVKAAELGPLQADYAQAAAMSLESIESWNEAVYWARETVNRSGTAPENLLLLQRIEAGAKGITECMVRYFESSNRTRVLSNETVHAFAFVAYEDA